MSDDPWYDVVGPDDPITRGDLVADCPLLGWKETVVPTEDGVVALSDLAHRSPRT